MGGHKGGMEASRMTIELVSHALGKQYERMQTFSADETRLYLRELFQDTSRKVHERGIQEPTLAHMGTTLVTWVQLGSEFELAHVGDSRAYLIRDNAVFQMTMDHSFVNEQIAVGAERDQLVGGSQYRHAIFRNIGMMPPSEPMIVRGEIRWGDIWLMCSDGLSNKMTGTEMLNCIKSVREQHAGDKNYLMEACRALVDIALERGGEDNITVLIFEMVK